jgi:hypothetical protein
MHGVHEQLLSDSEDVLAPTSKANTFVVSITGTKALQTSYTGLLPTFLSTAPRMVLTMTRPYLSARCDDITLTLQALSCTNVE